MINGITKVLDSDNFDWREAVGLQPIKISPPKPSTFEEDLPEHLEYEASGNFWYILETVFKEENMMSITLSKHVLLDEHFIYDDSNIADEVKAILKTFPEKNIKEVLESTDWELAENVEVNKASCAIARSSRRGQGNLYFDGSVFYKSDVPQSNGADAALYVYEKEFDGVTKYAIKKHPQFEKYGIRLVK